jgi:hypothetical protein
MDDAKTRQQIQDHADAVVRGDMDHVFGDFSDELRPQAPEIAKELPTPVKSAEVLSVDVGDEESVAQIKYTGDSGELTIQSHWRELGGRPQIVAGKPVG